MTSVGGNIEEVHVRLKLDGWVVREVSTLKTGGEASRGKARNNHNEIMILIYLIVYRTNLPLDSWHQYICRHAMFDSYHYHQVLYRYKSLPMT